MKIQQLSMFDGNQHFKIDKPIRLIELFAGYGSQALALKYLGVPFEHWKICEWAVKSIQAYKDVHYPDDNTDYSANLSDSEVKQRLKDFGISANYNEPIPDKSIDRMRISDCRKIFNNIIATKNLVNISKAKGQDLDITDTDKYCYIVTFSFPCQDLSLAGERKGMARGQTRSGLLWEVERLLKECKQLPQMLLMENVPAVIGKKNIADFKEWLAVLDSLGYTSTYGILKATDFGVPQDRRRCFCVSVLGNEVYEMPKPMDSKYILKDYLDKGEIPESYYLTPHAIEYLEWNAKKTRNEVTDSVGLPQSMGGGTQEQ